MRIIRLSTIYEKHQEAYTIATRIIARFLPKQYHKVEADWEFVLDGEGISCPQHSNEADSSIDALVTA